MYKTMPRTEVRPLIFNWDKMQAAQLKTLSEARLLRPARPRLLAAAPATA